MAKEVDTGLHFTREEEGGAEPPLAAELAKEAEEEEEARRPGVAPGRVAEGVERVAKAGKLPLHPAVIRLPFSIAGRVGYELTSYPGFVFTEQELNDLSELWMQCGVMMTPMLQAAIGTTAMLGAKSLGYFSW